MAAPKPRYAKKHIDASAYNHFLLDDVESDSILKHSVAEKINAENIYTPIVV